MRPDPRVPLSGTLEIGRGSVLKPQKRLFFLCDVVMNHTAPSPRAWLNEKFISGICGEMER